MKKSTLVIGLLIALAVGAVSVKSQQEPASVRLARELSEKPGVRSGQANPQSHSVLMLFYRVRVDWDINSGSDVYHGATVYVSSSSGNAPVFPQYPAQEVQVSDAIAKGLDAGLHIISFNGDGGIVLMSN